MSLTHTLQTGEHEIIVITDGGAEFNHELFPGTDAAHIDNLLASANTKTIKTNFNAFIVKSPNRTLLVDAGPRDLMGADCGKLPDGLTEAGIHPDDITHLMLTHLHPDHIAGAVTPENSAVFKNATVLINEDELAFWSRPTAFDEQMMEDWRQLAQAVLSAYGEQVQTFAGDADLGSGVSSISLPGHTPGHCGFRVDDGNASFVMATDILHAPVLQLADPEIGIVFDIDAEQARQTRKKTLAMIASDQLIFSGGHMVEPKLATLSAAGTGYSLESI